MAKKLENTPLIFRGTRKEIFKKECHPIGDAEEVMYLPGGKFTPYLESAIGYAHRGVKRYGGTPVVIGVEENKAQDLASPNTNIDSCVIPNDTLLIFHISEKHSLESLLETVKNNSTERLQEELQKNYGGSWDSYFSHISAYIEKWTGKKSPVEDMYPAIDPGLSVQSKKKK